MRVLVTGGAGFIGSHIAEAYLRRGDQVAILDDLSTGRRRNIPTEAQLYQGNIADRAFVRNAVEAWQPELINHHAAHISVSESVREPDRSAEVNVIGSINVFEAARLVGVHRIVVASTGGALYGEATVRPTPETAPTVPLSPYGLGKLAMEQFLEYYRVVYGIETVVLRYANVYGPRQGGSAETGVVATFVKLAMNGQIPTVFGDGTQTRDYVFVSDVVSANLAASERGSGAYNIGTGTETTVLEVFDAVRQVLDWAVSPVFAAPRTGEVLHSALDASRARAEFAWAPRVEFSEGVARTVEAERAA
ncbi:MAG: NAD-dependent epimerase/dehydratase family protein [Patescibacteria group bacterium]|jgi:UDP-glucose 4-epimerase